MLRLEVAAVALFVRLVNPAVQGTVRAADTAEPLANTAIEVVDGAHGTRSDSTGAYSLREIAPGRHTLRFSRIGYETLVVEVLVRGDAPVRLDAALSPKPAELAPVRVLASALSSSRDGGGSVPPAEPGSWYLAEGSLRELPHLAEPDALRALAGSAQGQMLPEQPSTLHFRGGSADQNLVLLDGIPVYNAVHASEVFSALNPDALGRVMVYGAVPPASLGGRLSSVIDVRTRDSVPQGLTARGALGMTAARATVDVPVVPGAAVVSLSARHSYLGLREWMGRRAGNADGWGDLLARSTFMVGDDELRLVSFVSGDRLTFEGGGAGGAPTPDGAAGGGAGTPGFSPRNLFKWSTQAHGLSWRHRTGARILLEASAWGGASRVGANWTSDARTVRLDNVVRHLGGTTSLSWTHGGGTASGGVTVERLQSRYDVSALRAAPVAVASGAHPPAPLLRRSADPVVASPFAQGWWRLGERVTLGGGARATMVEGAHARIEPRLTVTTTPSRHVTISAGYARNHQYLQSLRNEESLVDAVIGVDLPVAYGATGVPIARSDELAARVVAAFGDGMSVTLDGYTRRLGGLVLVAPATSEPFATDSFLSGGGRAQGIAVAVARETDRLSVHGSYAAGSVTRSPGDRRYAPTFAPAHAVSLAGGYWLGGRTRLRTAVSATSGRPTTPVAGDFGLKWEHPGYREREISRSPRSAAGALNAERLPVYVRLDAGVRHDIDVPRSRAKLSAFLNVDNVLQRRNVLAYRMPVDAELQRPVAMLPLSTTFGLEWRY
jgi:hypothetical protein